MPAVSTLSRRTIRRVVIPGVVVMAAAVAASTLAHARPAPASFADLAAKVAPAVVNISVEYKAAPAAVQNRDPRSPFPKDAPFREFFERFGHDMPQFQMPEQRRQTPFGGVSAVGSGFIIDPKGYVVTNHHVVANSAGTRVTLHDGESYQAKLIGTDPRTDLALLKIDAGRDLPAVAFGDSSKIRPGDWVMAVGNPFGLGGTITAGIVSARGRDLPGGTLVDFLQIDAPINRGNSGGPAFGADGAVIGVNTAIYSPTGGSVGIGFAIPANTAKHVIAELRENGHIERGWLGVSIQRVTREIAEGLGLDAPKGALVASIVANGPAAKGGVEPGDIIVGWDGKAIKKYKDLPHHVAATKVDKKIDVEIWRAGKPQVLKVTTGVMPEERKLAGRGTSKPGSVEPGHLAGTGITVVDLTDERREHYRIAKGVKGVVVAEVKPGSGAAARGAASGRRDRKRFAPVGSRCARRHRGRR